MLRSTLPTSDSHQRICPRCRSDAITALGRIFAGSYGVRHEYRCQVCATAFWLAAERRVGSPDRRAT
jgi:transposase-like protein